METARRPSRGSRRRHPGSPLFGQLLTAAVESAAGEVAIRYNPTGDPADQREMTYQELDEASSQLARELIERGIGPGDVVAIAKVDGARAGGWFGIGRKPAGSPAALPRPVTNAALAIVTRDRKDDVRLSTALQKLIEEDSSLAWEQDEAMHETLLKGVNDEHLNVTLAKLQRRYGVGVDTHKPGIAYRESVSVQTFFIADRLAQLEGGVTVIDEFTARAWQSPGYGWLPTDPPLGFTISYVTLVDRPPSKVARQFLRTLEEVLENSRNA